MITSVRHLPNVNEGSFSNENPDSWNGFQSAAKDPWAHTLAMDNAEHNAFTVCCTEVPYRDASKNWGIPLLRWCIPLNAPKNDPSNGWTAGFILFDGNGTWKLNADGSVKPLDADGNVVVSEPPVAEAPKKSPAPEAHHAAAPVNQHSAHTSPVSPAIDTPHVESKTGLTKNGVLITKQHPSGVTASVHIPAEVVSSPGHETLIQHIRDFFAHLGHDISDWF